MSRTDINVTKTTSGVFYNFGVKNDGLGPVPYTNMYNRVASTMKMTRAGTSTPWFFSKRAPQPLPINGYSFTYEMNIGEAGSESHVEYSLRPQDYGYHTSYSNGISGLFSVPGARSATVAELSQMDAEASNKLLNKIKGMTINVAQAIGERKQTAALIANTATKVAKSLIKLRKGDFVGAADALGVISPKRAKSRFNGSYARQQRDAAANAWLELQYGWKPLLSDVYGACEALAKHHNTTTVSRATVNKAMVHNLNYLNKTTAGSLTSYVSGQGTLKVNIRKSVTFLSPNKPSSTMAQLGISNPALLAWELLPFSFVADWFVPVGNFLSTLDATNGFEFVNGYRTVFSQMVFVGYRGSYGKSYGRNDLMNYSHSQVWVTFSRTALQSFPSPCRPYFKDPLSLIHVGNAIALLNNLFRK